MSERVCGNCKYSEPTCGALACMGQKYAPYVRPTDSCDSWKSAKQTNADRIRSMTDEELANFLMDVACRGGIETENGIARWTLIDWLKQECET